MYDFSKQKRLLKKKEFDCVFKQAKKIVTPEFIFLYCVSQTDHARLGMALSKKTIAKAHDRNRLKRMLRETFRLRHLPAMDIVVLARRGVANVEHSLITTKLGKAWDKLSALCNK